MISANIRLFVVHFSKSQKYARILQGYCGNGSKTALTKNNVLTEKGGQDKQGFGKAEKC